MPTYDYVCQACDHTFEEFQSITAKPLRKCPTCGKPKLKRLIGTGAGIIFKGSGFYETDYRSESYKKAAKAESEGGTAKSDSAPKSDAGAKPDAAASTPAKSETKTEAKAESKPAKTDSGTGKKKSKN